MISSGHSPGWLVPRKCAHVRPWKRFMVGTATIVTLSYLTVALVCACMDGMYLRLPAVQNLALATVASETPVPDTDEELCKFMHEQMLTLQASSAGSILVARISHMDVRIGEEMPDQTPILDAFRPPGNGFAPGRLLSFQLYSVLRI